MATVRGSKNEMLQRFVNAYGSEASDSLTPEILVHDTQAGLACEWYRGDTKPWSLSVDIESLLGQSKRFPQPKRGVLSQALGRKTHTIVDLTAGFGADSLLFWSQGYQVTMIERHPLLALLLKDAMACLSTHPRLNSAATEVPKVIEADAQDWLIQSLASQWDAENGAYDCLYLDPMFPPKRKRSAAPPKKMQFLQWLLGEQDDAKALANVALSSGVPRVVIKRPRYAEPLLDNPSERFSGKIIHYDVYLNHG